tara:strand:- start:1679 stop:2869 length:1191 start_codon:yes stop_codon:yes gene_type:complete
MNINNKIDYLVGQKSKLNICIAPFDGQIINFFDELSKIINSMNKKNFVDVKALSFFCRKKNILKLKSKYYNSKNVRYGLGTLFHITPSNIPTNFAYSLFFGLISGNSNIVKVPSKKFEEIDLICKSIKKVLEKKKFKKIKQMIAIVRYENYQKWTKEFSLMADGRLIWGGDQTINEIKKYETKAKNIDIPFSDRYSISIISSQKFANLSESKAKNLIKNFYNDTYSVDQNACSSPHLILWVGKNNSNSKKKFWLHLDQIVKKKYNPPVISVIDNYSRLANDLIQKKNIESFRRINKSLYVISLNKLNQFLSIKKTKWGFFYECNINNLNEIKNYTNRSLQTLTYFGFTKNYLTSFFKKNNFNGIDRIVPMGQALNINLIWDGYNLDKLLSREIEIN